MRLWRDSCTIHGLPFGLSGSGFQDCGMPAFDIVTLCNVTTTCKQPANINIRFVAKLCESELQLSLNDSRSVLRRPT